jgi:2-oxoglutarate ferredoxin oxidoreductase subunit gamma
MTYEIILAGFGGQGVMLMGQLFTYAGMIEKKNVSWMPSYGPEMRGGTANCSVIISDKPIGSPVVTEPTAVVVMNLPSLDKFAPMLVPGGVLFINSSLVEKDAKRKDVVVYRVPVNDIASELGNSKMANMVALGALNAALGFPVETASLLAAFEKMFRNKPDLVEPNRKAIFRGINFIEAEKSCQAG